jgi:hypothetical protein
MAASRTLKLTYLGDASNLSKTTNKAGDDVATLGERVGKVGKAIGVAFLAVGAAGIAMGKKLFDAFEEVTTANARIEAVVTSMGNFAGEIDGVTQRLVDQAEATARLTGVDRNLIKESQALLLTFDSVNKTAGDVGGVFDRATQAAVDLAAAGFGEVNTNAIQLGKALEDPIKGLTALGRSGVTFTDEQRELIKSLVESNRTLEAQGLILGAIEKQVGGVAEATANGSERMSQAFGILTESIGGALGPAFEFLAAKAIEFIDDAMVWWDANGEAVIESFRNFGTATHDLYIEMRDFTNLVVKELRANGVFARLQMKINDIKLSAENVGEAFQDFLTAVAGPSAESRAVTFAGLIETFYEKPIGKLLDMVDQALDALELLLDLGTRVAGVVSEIFSGERGNLNNLGFAGVGGIGGSGMSLSGSPAMNPKAQSLVNITVQGAIDPEGTARTIQRTLNDSRLRAGPLTAPGGGFGGIV